MTITTRVTFQSIPLLISIPVVLLGVAASRERLLDAAPNTAATGAKRHNLGREVSQHRVVLLLGCP